jgi:hypothetical protein
MSRLIFSTTICLLVLCTAPLILNAQQNPAGSVIEIISSPEKPFPDQNVSLELKSFSIDLSSAMISWYRNQTLIKQGTGETKIAVTAPKAGSSLTITAVASPQSGISLRQSITLKPEDVGLIFEAETYTPPFYQGKAYYTPEAIVRVVAIPNLVTSNGAKISPKNLVYQWKQDFKPRQDASGYGKNSLVFKGNLLQKPTTVQVEVKTVDGSRTGNAVLTIEPLNPEVLVYEDDPLYGILYNKTIAMKALVKNQEIKIHAVPFSFSVLSALSPTISYSWSVNGSRVENTFPKNSLVLRNEKAGAGNAEVSAAIVHNTNIFQNAGVRFPVMFIQRINTNNENSLFNQ